MKSLHPHNAERDVVMRPLHSPNFLAHGLSDERNRFVRLGGCVRSSCCVLGKEVSFEEAVEQSRNECVKLTAGRMTEDYHRSLGYNYLHTPLNAASRCGMGLPRPHPYGLPPLLELSSPSTSVRWSKWYRPFACGAAFARGPATPENLTIQEKNFLYTHPKSRLTHL